MGVAEDALQCYAGEGRGGELGKGSSQAGVSRVQTPLISTASNHSHRLKLSTIAGRAASFVFWPSRPRFLSAADVGSAAARLRLFTHSPNSHLVEFQTFLWGLV